MNACYFFIFLWLTFFTPACAQTTSPAQWQQNTWQRSCASLDMDFYNDRYYINNNSTCDGTTGTFYTAGSGNTGIQNFIAGTGASFTRAGTTNVTDTSPPFFTDSTQGQTWVSRASSATYFNSTGTLQTAATNVARSATYTYNGSSFVANSGTLIEPAETNEIRNNTMVGATAYSSTQLVTNGTFSGCSGSTCTGWTVTVSSGTGTVSFTSGTATLTGDGTNAAKIYQSITTVVGTNYIFSVTTGAGAAMTIRAGTGSNSGNLLGAQTQAASTTMAYQFTATTTTSYIQIYNTAASAATVTNVSVLSEGALPTNWAFIETSPTSLTLNVIGSGTESGINYVDVNLVGTPTATSTDTIAFETTTGAVASQYEVMTESAYVKLQAGSLSNVTFIALLLRNRSSSGVDLAQVVGSANFTPTGSGLDQQRNSVSTTSSTFSLATTAYAYPYFRFDVTAGQPVNVTFRIGMPQLEAGGSATTPIATSGSTVTRAADVYSIPAGGTYFNSSGVMKISPANTPRLDHNPVSPYLPYGILIEETRTNLITYSVPDGGTNWTYAADNTLGTANATTSLSGAMDAASLTDNSTSGSHYTTPTATISFTSGTTYTFSAYVQASTATVVQLALPSAAFGTTAYADFNLAGSAVSSTGSGTTAIIQALSNNWYRCIISAAATSTTTGQPSIALTNNSTTATALPSYTGSGEYLYIWGTQVEAGANVTSYIPSYGSAVARAEEQFTLLGTAGGGSGWLQNNVGTFGTVGQITFYNGGDCSFAGLDNGLSTQSINLHINASQKRQVLMFNGSNLYAGVINTLYTVGAVTKIATAYATNYETGAADNNGMTDGTAALPATQSRLNIGHSRGTTIAPLDGYDQRIWYIPTQQSDASVINYTQ